MTEEEKLKEGLAKIADKMEVELVFGEGIRKQYEKQRFFKSVKDMSLEELIDNYNRIQRGISKCAGFKDYHHKNYDGTFKLKKI